MVATVGKRRFFGWRVASGACLLAVFGWGTGFYGPPVFLAVLHASRGWPVGLIATAITVHFMTGALIGANLPALYRRLGAASTTRLAALMMAAGLVGWSHAEQPWQLFVACLLTGGGWSGMSAAAINALVAPWFERRRPAALALAYNGGSIGGIVFSPLWVAAIQALGFPGATIAVAAALVVTAWVLADQLFSQTPEGLGLAPDGDEPGAIPRSLTSPQARPLAGARLWRDRCFLTLAAGMGLGLTAQIGLVAHLYSLLVPALGRQTAGFAMALVTVMAIGGRTLLGALLPASADRRLVAAGGYGVQLLGSLAFLAANGESVPLLLLGVVLFGAGFGNATSLPPLIAQVEFVKGDVVRAVALVVGVAQGLYAFAPAGFGLAREWAVTGTALPATVAHAGSAPGVFALAALAQGLAIMAFFIGRGRRGQPVAPSHG